MMLFQTMRKPINEISGRDLEECPVWEFASDEEGTAGQDETTVRPVMPAKELDAANSDFVVRARFLLSDGTRMIGYLTPRVSPDNGVDALQPVIVTDYGRVLLWWGVIEPEPAR